MKHSLLLVVEMLTLALVAWLLPGLTGWVERSLQTESYDQIAYA